MKQMKMNEVIEQIASFPLEDQEYILDTITRRIHETKRAQLLERAKEAETNYQSGNVTTGTVKDLMMSLNDA